MKTETETLGVEHLRNQLDMWDKEIEKLKTSSKEEPAEVQIKYYKQIEELRLQQKSFREKLAMLGHVEDDAWEALKQDIGTYWQNFKSTFEETKKAFHEGLEEKKEEEASLKKSFQQKLEARLSEWDAEIEKLKAKADKVEADLKIDYYKQMGALQERRNAAKKKLEELRLAGDEAWEDLKSGVENSCAELGKAVKSAVSKFQ